MHANSCQELLDVYHSTSDHYKKTIWSNFSDNYEI
jgi:hypothetical protein